jgi:hypothetical protein
MGMEFEMFQRDDLRIVELLRKLRGDFMVDNVLLVC